MRRSELFTMTSQVEPLNCAPIALIKTVVLWLYSVAFASTALLYGLISATYLWMQIIMVALWNRADHYILPCGYFFLFFIPRLISAAADWMSAILAHMMWP